eukprot:7185135-Heterocapsa_arctica.AAC.1
MGGALQWACDISPSATGNFNLNFHGAQTTSIDNRSCWKHLEGIDVITAGFPCQSFSGAGTRNGLKDPRGTTIYHIIEISRATRPRCLVLECVWAFFKKPSWRKVATEGFGSMGYHCH